MTQPFETIKTFEIDSPENTLKVGLTFDRSDFSKPVSINIHDPRQGVHSMLHIPAWLWKPIVEAVDQQWEQ